MLSFLSDKFFSVFDKFKSIKKISKEDITSYALEFKKVLLEADVPFEIAEHFEAQLIDRTLNKEVKYKMSVKEFLVKQIYDLLIEILTPSNAFNSKNDFLEDYFAQKKFDSKKQKTILLAGLQGAGKTTTIGKLVKQILFNEIEEKEKNEINVKNSILVISIDFYRPAARDQLRLLCSKLNVEFFETINEKPLDVLKEGILYGKTHNKEYILVDTAGRMHLDEAMMNELKDGYNILNPDLTFLVLDGMMGQYALKVAEEFNKLVSFDAAIITKLDSETKGGVAFSFAYKVKKPIAYTGSGEKLEDLNDFNPERITKSMFGEGDFDTLLKSAKKKLSKSVEEDFISESMKRGDISLNEYFKLITMMKQMGPLKNMLSAMPKQQSASVSDQHIELMEKMFIEFPITQTSMTKKEIKYPILFEKEPSRLIRVSKGSGVSLAALKNYFELYNNLKSGFKMLSKMGLFK
jgi:signal recognition particle subunit SRP54